MKHTGSRCAAPGNARQQQYEAIMMLLARAMARDGRLPQIPRDGGGDAEAEAAGSGFWAGSRSSRPGFGAGPVLRAASGDTPVAITVVCRCLQFWATLHFIADCLHWSVKPSTASSSFLTIPSHCAAWRSHMDRQDLKSKSYTTSLESVAPVSPWLALARPPPPDLCARCGQGEGLHHRSRTSRPLAQAPAG